MFGVPIIGDNVVGFEMRLFEREEPAATIPKSMIDGVAPGTPTFDSLRLGEIELRRLVREPTAWLAVILVLRGILEGELWALLTTRSSPFW